MRTPSSASSRPAPTRAPSAPDASARHAAARWFGRLGGLRRTPPATGIGQPGPGRAARSRDWSRLDLQRGPRLRIRWWPVVGILVTLAFLAWLVVFSPLVGVREVAVAGVAGQERDAIARIGSQAKGQPLVKVDSDRIANAVIDRGTVARVDVERHWPTTLLIRVKPREAMYYLPNAQGGVQVFDADGFPFWNPPTPPAGVPPATLANPEDAAQRTAAATVVRALSAAQRAQVGDVRIDAPDRITVTVNDIVVTWGGPERSEVKAKIVDVLARRQGVTKINVVVPETPVTGGRTGPTPKP